MKPWIIVFLPIISFQTNAQTYVPIISTSDSSDVWWDSYTWHLGGGYYQYHDKIYQIKGDITIGSEIYAQLWLNFFKTFDNPYPIPDTYESELNFVGGIREDSGKVYLKQSGLSEQLVYDFTVSIGDSVPNPGYPYTPKMEVVAIDSILIGSGFRKRFKVMMSNMDTCYIIEGIGSSEGFLEYAGTILSSVNHLKCYQEYGVNLIGTCDFKFVGIESEPSISLHFYPNPVQSGGDLFIETGTNEPVTITVTDITGKTISTQQTTSSTFNLHVQTAGQYILRFETMEGIVVYRKVVVVG